MNVLHVVCTMDPRTGGVSQAIRLMIKGLTSQGLNSKVVSMGSAETDFRDDFAIHFVGNGRSSWNFNPGLRDWLGAHMTSYDAVIVHGMWQYHTFAVSYLIKRATGKFPRVYLMPHGMLDPWFQNAPGRAIKAIRNRLIWKMAEHRIVNETDGLLFTCETEKILARQAFRPYHPKAEHVVGLGVDSPPPYETDMTVAFHQHCKVPKDGEYILYLGRLDPKKGLDLLINAYVSLKRQGYRLPELVVAGPGLGTPYADRLRKLAANESGIHFPGMLRGSAKWGAFYGCEAFILPSHQENFGIAVVEALACHKPVLISNQVNIWREIAQRGSGIVENNTLEGAATLLTKWIFLADEEKVTMGHQARETYLQHYAVENTSAALSRALSGKTDAMHIPV
jgi:glycosyltransferase involved in cell wall biosynthesis